MTSHLWNISFPSPVDDILKKPGFTLQDLLDDDDVVPETRNHKQELVIFLSTIENLSQLITYLITDYNENDVEITTTVKFRYPAVACEILCAENSEIERVLLENEDLLDRIFGFFQSPKINLLLANVVVKVAKALTASRTEAMLNYLKRKFHFLDGFLEHLEATAVTEYFTRLISMEGIVDGMNIQHWLSENLFVEKLISKLGVKYTEIHSDVAQSMMDIITISPVGSPLMNRFMSEDCVNLLFNTILDPGNSHAFKYGMKVFNRLLKGVSNFIIPEDNPDSEEDEELKGKITKPDPLGPIDQLPIPVQLFIGQFDRFIGLLDHPVSTIQITDQSHKSFEAFGFDRIVILETIDILLDLNYVAVNKHFLESELFTIALGLIYRFSCNNFCHRSTESIIIKFLENSGSDAQLAFLQKTQLAHKLLETEKSSEKPLYRPYFHRMTYNLGEISEKSPLLKTELDVIEGWNDFLNEIKEERKKLETAVSAAKIEEEPSNFQPPSVPDPSELEGSDAYEEGRDDDDEDLNLDDDQDMDSANDADDYDADQAEILLTKQEIEASA